MVSKRLSLFAVQFYQQVLEVVMPTVEVIGLHGELRRVLLVLIQNDLFLGHGMKNGIQLALEC